MTLKVTRTGARIAVYQGVSRARTEWNISAPGVGGSRFRFEHIARSANCMDELPGRDFFHVPAKPIDVRLDQIGERIELLPPHVLGDLLPSHDAPAVPREVLQHGVLLGRQGERLSIDAHPMRAGIDLQLADLEDCR